MIYYASGQDFGGLSDMDEEYQFVPQPAGIYMGHVLHCWGTCFVLYYILCFLFSFLFWHEADTGE